MSERKKGATSVSLEFRLIDSTTGAAKSGVDVTTLKLQYCRPGEANGSATSLTLLAALTTAWTSYAAKEHDATNSKGIYRVDCPDAAFATGVDEVTLSVSGTGIETASRLIDLTSFDARDGVHGGLTALPNTACTTNASLLTSGTGTDQIVASSGKVKLASDGLDSISTTAPSGVASNFREMLVQVWRRFFRKAERTTTQIKTYADDGTTVVTTQTISDDLAGHEVQGTAS